MAEEPEGTGGFTGPVTEQDVLKVFDYHDDPVLSAREVAGGLRRFGEGRVTSEAVRTRLEELHEAGLVEHDADLVEREELGGPAVGWRATVAPEVDAATADRLDSRKDSDEWVSL